MSINTQTLYDQKKNQYGTGTSPTRFSSDFLQAVNRTLNEINSRCGIDADAVTAIGNNIDVDSDYEYLVSVGVDYHLSHMGSYNIGEKSELKALFDDAKRSARTDVMKAANVKGRLGDLTD